MREVLRNIWDYYGMKWYCKQCLVPLHNDVARCGCFYSLEAPGTTARPVRSDIVVCITTNATIKNNGAIVMGRGVAFEAATKFIALPFTLGAAVKDLGNVPTLITITGKAPGFICSFPVKHQFWERADLELIKQSAEKLKEIADKFSDRLFVLPRPGCNNGRRTWTEVKPMLSCLPKNVIVAHKEDK